MFFLRGIMLCIRIYTNRFYYLNNATYHVCLIEGEVIGFEKKSFYIFNLNIYKNFADIMTTPKMDIFRPFRYNEREQVKSIIQHRVTFSDVHVHNKNSNNNFVKKKKKTLTKH